MWDNAYFKIYGEFFNSNNDKLFVWEKFKRMSKAVTSNIQFIQYLKRSTLNRSLIDWSKIYLSLWILLYIHLWIWHIWRSSFACVNVYLLPKCKVIIEVWIVYTCNYTVFSRFMMSCHKIMKWFMRKPCPKLCQNPSIQL